MSLPFTTSTAIELRLDDLSVYIPENVSEEHLCRVETAKENGLNPYQYLIYIFEELPNVDPSNENTIDQLLPWSNSLPTRCRIQHINRLFSPHLINKWGLFDAYKKAM